MAAERRRRRNQDTKKENHERWVISYADFMTLLLATFVVLYAVSSINVSRYRAAAEALSAVFTGKVLVQDKGEGAQPSGLFENLPAPVPKPIMKPEITVRPADKVPDKVRERLRKLNDAYKNLTHLLQDVIAKGQVHIAHNGLSVVIDINASVLFDSGKAELTNSALGVIDQIGVVLKDSPYSIQVNGFTDNAPIHTALFSSNWELSAIRAISVVKRFVNDGVDPSRLVAAGYGEYHPVTGNDTPEDMVKNRRVQIVILSVDDDGHAANAVPAATPEPPRPDAVSALHPATANLIGHPVPRPDVAPVAPAEPPAPLAAPPSIEPVLNLPRPIVPELSH
ncbi:MAG TPA: OmpA family protein [Stellaceae bacterium]|nr:OmpA family protein [Stellaceae bacterium]